MFRNLTGNNLKPQPGPVRDGGGPGPKALMGGGVCCGNRNMNFTCKIISSQVKTFIILTQSKCSQNADSELFTFLNLFNLKKSPNFL